METDVSARFDSVDARFDRLEVKIDKLTTTVDRVVDMVVVQQRDVTEIKDRLTKLESAVAGMAKSIDTLAKLISDMMLENAVIKIQLSRHETWFKQLAEKVGIELKV